MSFLIRTTSGTQSAARDQIPAACWDCEESRQYLKKQLSETRLLSGDAGWRFYPDRSSRFMGK